MSSEINLRSERNPIFSEFSANFEADFRCYLNTVNEKMRAAAKNAGLEHTQIFSNQSNQDDDQLDRLFQYVDLTICPSDSPDPLPVYSVTRKYYDQIKVVFSKIVKGETSIRINGDSGDREMVLLDILILLSRPSSLSLVAKLARHRIPTEISATWDKTVYKPNENKACLRYEPTVTVIAETENGERFLSELPRWIQLAHELTHALHYRELPEGDMLPYGIVQMLGLDKEYHNTAERYVIVGDTGSPSHPFHKENENNYCKEFNVPYRKNHLGSKFSSDVPLHEQLQGKGKTAFMNAVGKGALLNVAAWFENKDNKLDKIADRDFLLHKAIKHRRDKIASLLIEKGAPLDKPDKSGKTPLEWAKDLGQNEIAQQIEDRLLKTQF